MTRTKNNGNKTKIQGNGQKSRLAEAIQAWLVVRLSQELNVPPEEINADEPLLGYGLNSVVAFGITGELADRLNCELPATLFWDWPTLKALAGYLADEINDGLVAESVLAGINPMQSRVEELPKDELSKHRKKQH